MQNQNYTYTNVLYAVTCKASHKIFFQDDKIQDGIYTTRKVYFVLVFSP